jgi:hypothetical protein
LLDYERRTKGNFEYVLEGRVIGRIEFTVCVRANGTAYNINGETTPPKPN